MVILEILFVAKARSGKSFMNGNKKYIKAPEDRNIKRITLSSFFLHTRVEMVGTSSGSNLLVFYGDVANL